MATIRPCFGAGSAYFEVAEMRGRDRARTDGAKIEDAFGELTHEGFAVWILMMTLADGEFAKGQAHLAERCGYSARHFRRVLRELVNKGFLSIEKSPNPSVPSRVVLQRRAIIVGVSRFINLSTDVAEPGKVKTAGSSFSMKRANGTRVDVAVEPRPRSTTEPNQGRTLSAETKKRRSKVTIEDALQARFVDDTSVRIRRADDPDRADGNRRTLAVRADGNRRTTETRSDADLSDLRPV